MNFYAYAMSEKVIEAMSSNSRFFQPAYNENTSHFRRHIFKRRKPRYHQMLSTICGVASPKQIDYAGINNYSQFSYDGLSRNTKIVETTSGSVMSTKQFVLSSGSKREERDAGSSVSRRFFSLGQTISGTSYFYARCRPGSVTEMTDGSGNVQAQYAFDPFGRSTKLQGGLEADFQYAGYYMHQRSGLYLPVFRAYSAKMGRWISRDPIEEVGGHNLLTYVSNDPVLFVDPTGLQGFALPVEWAWLCSTASGRAVLAWILRMRGGAAAATGAAAACKSCDGPPPKRDPTKPPGSEGGPLGPPTPPTPPPIITPPPGSMPPIGGPIGPIEPPGPIDMTPPPTYPTEPPGHFDPPYEGPMGVPD